MPLKVLFSPPDLDLWILVDDAGKVLEVNLVRLEEQKRKSVHFFNSKFWAEIRPDSRWNASHSSRGSGGPRR